MSATRRQVAEFVSSTLWQAVMPNLTLAAEISPKLKNTCLPSILKELFYFFSENSSLRHVMLNLQGKRNFANVSKTVTLHYTRVF